jgi:hypothetical protein
MQQHPVQEAATAKHANSIAKRFMVRPFLASVAIENQGPGGGRGSAADRQGPVGTQRICGAAAVVAAGNDAVWLWGKRKTEG